MGGEMWMNIKGRCQGKAILKLAAKMIKRKKYAAWTRRLILDRGPWLKRSHRDVDYFLTRALSGHGCFKKYLYDRRRADSDKCTYCWALDDVEHTLSICLRWVADRFTMKRMAALCKPLDNNRHERKWTSFMWKDEMSKQDTSQHSQFKCLRRTGVSVL